MRRGPLIAGALALVTALGTTLPWVRVGFISMDGTDSNRGIVTLFAALAGAGICGWRTFYGLGAGWYFGAGLPLGLLALSMSAWFLIDVRDLMGFYGEGVFIVTPGFALYLTVGAAFAYVASLLFEVFTMIERRPKTPLEWLRSLDDDRRAT